MKKKNNMVDQENEITHNHFLLKGLLNIGLVLGGVVSLYGQGNEDMSKDKTLSPYFVVISEDPKVDNLPLKETSVEANIVGVIADVTVKQVYTNTGKNTIEAIYTFPLSTKAAVYGMTMTIGSRIITAKIEEKEKARKDYEKAKSEGKRASLLEQSRPNVFTMNVTNIAVNDTIIVELKYTELLVPENGVYSFVYPTVVGPRYSNKSKDGAGAEDEFVATPYTKSGEMPAYIFGFNLSINAGIPIQNVDCSTHKTQITHPSLNRAFVRLDSSETKGGNRDVIIKYSLQGNKIESGLMLYEGEDENFFLLMVQPPKKILKEDIPQREYIFIVDVSGSMHGFPLDVSKKLLRNLILNLNPNDKFNVLLFSGITALLSETSLDATTENVNKAVKFIDKQQGGGGTELMQALEIANKIPRPNADLSRAFVIVTDGYIAAEREAFQFIRNNNYNTNVFSFGIGSSVNRYLIEGLAFMGNGEPMIITKPNEADKEAERFRNYINTPLLTRIKVDYGAFQTMEVEPSSVVDMLAERPIVIFGKYKGTPTGTITVTGKAGGKNYKQSFSLSDVKADTNYAAIRYLWARERIKLLDYMQNAENYSYADNENKENNNVKKITELGLKYNLMTNYTSFIAIDEQLVMKDGKLITVKQPVPLPEGVSDYAVGYEIAGMSTMSGVSVMAERAVFEPSSISHKQNALIADEMIEIMDTDEDPLFSVVEEMPEFPGGEDAREKFIVNNLVMPNVKLEGNKEYRTLISFIVEIDGSISNVKIAKSCGVKKCDNEALRIIKLMPNWTPGKHEGKPVRVNYQLPITFTVK
ncbi:MAG: TonB family protein [Bacteroidales bacterium]|jgi:Ca-activated chloride channel family protein|nr:TonB family protein [Bacteroidales bacterium]